MNVAPVARGTLVPNPAYAVRYGEVLRVVELDIFASIINCSEALLLHGTHEQVKSNRCEEGDEQHHQAKHGDNCPQRLPHGRQEDGQSIRDVQLLRHTNHVDGP